MLEKYFPIDVRVFRTANFGNRMNEGLSVEVITGPRPILLHDKKWNSISGGVADRDVVLPPADAGGPLGGPIPLGWAIVIHNTGATNSLIVKDGGAGAVLKTITAPASPNDTGAYEFRCFDNSSPEGLWYVTELGDAALVAVRVFADFVVADWPVPVDGLSVMTDVDIAMLGVATHGRTDKPTWRVEAGPDITAILDWITLTPYVVGDRVVPTVDNGYYYECAVAGTTDVGEPVWVLVPGTTQVDGTVTWQCHANFESIEPGDGVNTLGDIYLAVVDGAEFAGRIIIV